MISLKRINFQDRFSTNLKIAKNNKLEKFREVYIKQKTCKKLNGRAIETFLSINPPTPKLARSAPVKNNRFFVLFCARINLIQKVESISAL
jgi:hypothetical protein